MNMRPIFTIHAAGYHQPLGIGLLCLVCALGCGSGERRYHLSGQITYKGKPVPSGYLIFEPDTSKGNSGGPGTCKIIEGKYDTRSENGTGILGGPHLVRIRGFDAVVTGQGSGTREVVMPNSLFEEYVFNEDLPKQNGTKDFDVPVKR